MSAIPKEDVIRLCNALHDFAEVVEKAAAPAPAKTRGQEVAEGTIYVESNDGESFHVLWKSGGAPLILHCLHAEGAKNYAGVVRVMLAAAIDRAIAEEREACAVAGSDAVEKLRQRGITALPPDVSHAIRNRK